jgi:gas vesicle protein
MKNENSYKKQDIFLSFLVGGIIGAGFAVLFASRSGRETRQMIKDFTGKATDKAKKRFEDAKEKAISTAEKGKEHLGQKKSAVSAAFEAGKEAYNKETE